MMKKCLLIACLSFPFSATANTYLSDLSDLWWNPNESGWGVTITHSREVVFLTFFIYGADGKATWYTGQADYVSNTSPYVFTGSIYQVSGPWFRNYFDPALVNGRVAGTMTLTAFLETALLTYTIDGVTVSKAISRQTLRNNDLTGSYIGGIKQAQIICRAPFSDGSINSYANFTVASTATTFAMTTIANDGSSCSYTGNYSQSGRMGRSQGNYTCSSGAVGTYDAVEIDANVSGFTGRFSASDNYCSSITGRFAAMRK